MVSSLVFTKLLSRHSLAHDVWNHVINLLLLSLDAIFGKSSCDDSMWLGKNAILFRLTFCQHLMEDVVFIRDISFLNIVHQLLEKSIYSLDYIGSVSFHENLVQYLGSDLHSNSWPVLFNHFYTLDFQFFYGFNDVPDIRLVDKLLVIIHNYPSIFFLAEQ